MDLRCSLNTLCKSNAIFFQGLQLLSLCLNSCLCLDLILTLWSPFTPAANRAKYYYIVCLALTGLMMAYLTAVTFLSSDGTVAHSECRDCLDQHASQV